MKGKEISIKVISGLGEARDVWNKISPNESIYDDWNFRHCFYKYFNQPLRFYAGYDQGELVGLLALQYNSETKRLEFFGGSFMEDNHVFIKKGYEEYIPKFYESIKEVARLEDVCDASSFESSLDFFEDKYVKNIQNMKNMDEYLLKTFRKKRRNAFKKQIKEFEMLNLNIIENNYEDLDVLIDLNKKAFKGESTFNYPHRAEIYRDLVNSKYDIRMMTFVLDGEKKSVSVSLKYKGTYIYLNTGTDKKRTVNLGTYNIYKNVEKAIMTHSTLMDAGTDDCGWKEKWHFEKIPQRIFVKQ